MPERNNHLPEDYYTPLPAQPQSRDSMTAKTIVPIVVGAAAVFIGFLTSIRVVPPASIGVQTVLGSVAAHTLESGLHICNPLSSVISVSTKTQLFEMANHVPTREGVTVELDVAVLFHVDPAAVRDLFLRIGEDFVQAPTARFMRL